LSRGENTPDHKPLAAFPSQVGSWRTLQEGVIDEQQMKVLRADDTLSRIYSNDGGEQTASLFVAYFRSQRTGQAPHSPKNCLPGSGWVPTASKIIHVPVPGDANPIPVNQYVVAKGDTRSVVLYWYQSSKRVIASEYAAKVYLVADAIRYNRTDTALVRVVVPIREGGPEASAATAMGFVQALFPELRRYLPS
jgi:EpsI family protein